MEQSYIDLGFIVFIKFTQSVQLRATLGSENAIRLHGWVLFDILCFPSK